MNISEVARSRATNSTPAPRGETIVDPVDPPVLKVYSPHTFLQSRVSSLAASPNMVYMGSVNGDIKVVGRANGQEVTTRWDRENTPIEGIMYDYEDKVVYATEERLVVVDRDLRTVLKEYKSYDPLRKIISHSFSQTVPHWQKNEGQS